MFVKIKPYIVERDINNKSYKINKVDDMEYLRKDCICSITKTTYVTNDEQYLWKISLDNTSFLYVDDKTVKEIIR